MPRLLLLFAFFLAGCAVGPSLDEYPPARRPAGAHATIETETATYVGELMAVRTEGLILRLDSPQRLAQIDYDVIYRGEFDAPGAPDISTSFWTPSDEWRRTLGLHSRFPQDISPDLMTRLLDQYDQPELITIP